MSSRNSQLRSFAASQLCNSPRHRSFYDTLWNHKVTYGTGKMEYAYSDSTGEYLGESREETKTKSHYGQRENCRKCHKEDTVGDARNVLSFQGWVSLVAILTTLIVIVSMLGAQ